MTTSPPVVRDSQWLVRGAPELLPAKWVAEALKITPKAVMQLVEEGTLPAIQMRRRTLISRQAVLDLIGLQRAD